MEDHARHIKTIFCDIDGCVFAHKPSIFHFNLVGQADLLPGVYEAFSDWQAKGYRVVVTTGRPETLRKMTEEQLQKFGLYYNELVMDLPRGMRVVINDFKPGSTTPAASGLSLKRNEGMTDVDI